MSGVVGYSLKGIDAELTKGKTEKIFDPIISARMAQGELDYLEASEEEKREIVHRWCARMSDKQKKKAQKNDQKKSSNIEELGMSNGMEQGG